MGLFSERYGYAKPSNIIIRERITIEIENAICSCYDRLEKKLYKINYTSELYNLIEIHLWCFFFNEREGDYRNRIVSTAYIQQNGAWYKKLDLIETTIEYVSALAKSDYIDEEIPNWFINELNYEFERLKFAYRIIDDKIVEITSEEEIIAIEKALEDSQDNVKSHLSKSLELYAKKPIGDYSNSIKESISAVEAMSRNITGENVLNFKKMEEKSVIIPPVLRQAFEKLYGYTNDKSTGIRHALMEDTNLPQAEEALFMLVSCSAFINYVNKKIKE